MPDEIQLNDEEEAALDLAWRKLSGETSPGTKVPVLGDEVWFGDPESEQPDWEAIGPDDSDDDGEVSPAVAGLTGLDADDMWPEDDEEEEDEDDLDDDLKAPRVRPSPFLKKNLNGYRVKSEQPAVSQSAGKPCEQGQSAKQTGCIPAEDDAVVHSQALAESGHPKKRESSDKLEVRPPDPWKEKPIPGNGASHVDHVVLGEQQDGPLIRWVGPDKYDYELVGRKEREAGNITELRDIDPDEPHSSRDYNYARAFSKARGGSYVDRSPDNPDGLNKTVLKFWSTAGTKAGTERGAQPQHTLIRKAADKRFGLSSGTYDRGGLINKLSEERAQKMAKNLIQSIANADPAQPVLWRGIYGEQGKKVQQANPGDMIDFSLGSTSRDVIASLGYAGTDIEKGSVIIRILPGARGIANRDYFPHDQEVITGGRFKVMGTSKSEKTGLTVVDVEQIGVFRW